MKELELGPYELEREFLKSELESTNLKYASAHFRKIPVTATTIESSKGLTSDYVFITHLDDRYLLADTDGVAISDKHVCKFLVAMTRARSRLYLIPTVERTTPTFLRWIHERRIQKLTND